MKGTLHLFLLVTLFLGSCLASVLGPLETTKHKAFEDEFDSEERVDPPDFMEVGRMIMTAMQSLLANQERAMDLRLKKLELYVYNTCTGMPAAGGSSSFNPAKEVRAEMSQMFDGFVASLASMSRGFMKQLDQQFEVKVNLALMKMEEKLADLTESSSSSSSESLESYITTFNSNEEETTAPRTSSSELEEEKFSRAISKAVQNQVKNVVTRSDLQKQTELLQKQFGLVHSFGSASSSTDNKILNYTKEVYSILYSFKPIYDTFQKVANNCDAKDDLFYQIDNLGRLLQKLREDVNDNGNTLTSMFMVIENAEHLLSERLTEVADGLKLQHQQKDAPGNYSSPPPPPTSITSPSNLTAEEVQPVNGCEDSVFENITLDICSDVISSGNCSIPIIGYHCCRSCTDAGLLDEMGPHRFLNITRRVRLWSD